MKSFFSNHKILFVLVIIVFLLLLVFLVIKLVGFFVPTFGSLPSCEDKKDYQKRMPNNYDGKRFYNWKGFEMFGEYTDKYKDRTTGKGVKPVDSIPVNDYVYSNTDDLSITWFGHSTILVNMSNLNILVDPIWNKSASPVSFTGPERYSDMVDIEGLPNIDVLLITHDHFDHLDIDTIRKLDYKVSKYIVPLGVENHLEKFGVSKSKISNIAWWEDININDLKIISTPAIHDSSRYLFRMDRTLWTSWTLVDKNHKVFISGDTGYGDHFKEIYKKYGAMDIALLDSAQYNERWHAIHMFPEEAVEAGIDLGAKVMMPVHWGSYVLSDHSWDDPPARFSRYAEENNQNYIVPKIGETVDYNNFKNYQDKWWNDIK